MSKIDWDKPIEMVTPGGAIYPARFITTRRTGKDQGALRIVLYLSGGEEIVVYCFENGTIENSVGKIVVRNKKEKVKKSIYWYKNGPNKDTHFFSLETPEIVYINYGWILVETIEREYEI